MSLGWTNKVLNLFRQNKEVLKKTYSFTVRIIFSKCFYLFCEKGVLRNFAKFKGKHLCQTLFLQQSCSLQARKFIKKGTLAQVFSCKFCKISENTFCYRTPPVAASGETKRNSEVRWRERRSSKQTSKVGDPPLLNPDYTVSWEILTNAPKQLQKRKIIQAFHTRIFQSILYNQLGTKHILLFRNCI